MSESPTPGWWDRLWFTPSPPTGLAAARILIAAHALWVLLSRDPAALSGLPSDFWSEVIDTARWRFLIFEGRPALEHALQWTAVAALVSALLGIWPRLSCLLAGLLLYHLAPLETMIFTPSPWVKGFTLSVLALLVLGVSRSGDTLAWVGERSPENPSWQYTWPLRLIQAFLCQVYFFAGYAKLFKTGWAWMDGEPVRRYLLQYNQNPQIAAFQGLGSWIAQHPGLCMLAAVGALLFDLLFWTVLVSRTARRWLVPIALAGHLLIFFSLNIAFLETPLLLLFVDWDRLRNRRAESA